MIHTWCRDKLDDLRYWIKHDRPLVKLWRGIKDRLDAVAFCLMLLVVGVYSPRILRKLIIDSINNTK